MTTPYDIITFDCYGTLVDWDGGIASAFEHFASTRGLAFDRAKTLEAYHAAEPEVESETYRDYRSVLAETAERAARGLGWSIESGGGAFLPESFDAWTPFDETNLSLERLSRAGIRLGILSNVDDDLLAITRRKLTVDFDLIVTAQQVQSYKPAAGHFVEARTRIGDARWLHAAQSYFHDIVPAVTHGIPCAWINRKNEKPDRDERPDRELSNLTGLADWIAG